MISKGFENVIPWEFQMLLRYVYQHYHPWKKPHSSHHVTQRFYRTEGLLPEVTQLLCSAEDDGSSQILVWGIGEGYLQCYGDDYCWNCIWELLHQWFLKTFENFPPSELEKMFSLPAVEYHSVSYSMHHLVLFLKDICFTWGKYSIFLVHFSVEKHFFWYSAKVSFLSQPTPP